MKIQFLPYYLSRALLSSVFAIFIAGFTWKSIIIAVVFFGFFLLYLNSGWFQIDSENTLLPIRRDPRGQQVQRKALITAILFGFVTYFSLSVISKQLDLALVSGNIALAFSVVAYFTSQFILFSKA